MQNTPEFRKKREQHPNPFFEAGKNLKQKRKITSQFQSNIALNHQTLANRSQNDTINKHPFQERYLPMLIS